MSFDPSTSARSAHCCVTIRLSRSKRSEAPKVTNSMRIAMQDLGLDELVVLHGGRDNWAMGDRMRAVAAVAIPNEIAPLR